MKIGKLICMEFRKKNHKFLYKSNKRITNYDKPQAYPIQPKWKKKNGKIEKYARYYQEVITMQDFKNL